MINMLIDSGVEDINTGFITLLLFILSLSRSNYSKLVVKILLLVRVDDGFDFVVHD
jgi:hypothetical protein